MKIWLFLFLMFMISACTSPSEYAIQTAIAQTESAKISESAIKTAIAKTQTAELPGVTQCKLKSPLKNEWETIVCDTFDNNKNNWWTGLDTDIGVDINIHGGKYYIDYSSENATGYTTGFYTALQVGEAKDYVVSLTGKMTSVYKQCNWGLIVRGDWDEGYEFFVDNQGNYFLTNNGASNSYIGNIKYGSHNAIRWDSENTITILVEGNKMSFYVNGKPIISHEANNSTKTQISWSVWAAEGVTVLYEFDDLLIKEKSSFSG